MEIHEACSHMRWPYSTEVLGKKCHLCLTTGTSSGKSLAFALPILEALATSEKDMKHNETHISFDMRTIGFAWVCSAYDKYVILYIIIYIILYNIVVHIDIDAESSACFGQINQLRTAKEQYMTATAVVTMASADNVLFADGRHIVKIQTPKLWCFFRQRPESAENWRALMESHMQHAHYDLPIILLANFPWILIKDQFSNANKTL